MTSLNSSGPNPTRGLLLALSVLVASCGGGLASPPPSNGASAAADRWPVILGGNTWIGERGHADIRWEHTVRQTVRAPGRSPQRMNLDVSVHLVADYEVLELDDEGDAQRVRYVVREFVEVLDGRRTSIARRGAVIEVARERRADDSLATIDGQPASANQRRALEVTQGLANGRRQGPDWRESQTPRAVGEHWQPDLDGIMDGFADTEHYSVPRDAVVADIQITSHRRDAERDILGVEARFTASRLELNGLGRGAVATSSGMEQLWVSERAADRRPIPGRSRSEFSMDSHWNIAQPVEGGTGTIEYRSTTRRTTRSVQAGG